MEYFYSWVFLTELCLYMAKGLPRLIPIVDGATSTSLSMTSLKASADSNAKGLLLARERFLAFFNLATPLPRDKSVATMCRDRERLL